MRLEIFDVGHGACALLTADDGTRIMLDCGHRGTPFPWSPADELRRRGVTTLDRLYVTNYDEDHVSGIADLLSVVDVHSIYRNASVSPAQIQQLKSEDGMGPGIGRLVHALTHTFTSTLFVGSEPAIPGLTVDMFYNVFPSFVDENNLSLIVWLECHGIGVMFTGDMEIVGFQPLLHDPVFVDRLSRTSVLIAPHHGRDSGCCPDVATHCQPFYVVVSDKEHMYDTQKTHAHYSSMAKGGPFRDQPTRHVLTTRRDGAITFDFQPGPTWSVR